MVNDFGQMTTERIIAPFPFDDGPQGGRSRKKRTARKDAKNISKGAALVLFLAVGLTIAVVFMHKHIAKIGDRYKFYTNRNDTANYKDYTTHYKVFLSMDVLLLLALAVLTFFAILKCARGIGEQPAERTPEPEPGTGAGIEAGTGTGGEAGTYADVSGGITEMGVGTSHGSWSAAETEAHAGAAWKTGEDEIQIAH